eukprot:1156437-Pelagomonas_calceolata.AAC.9
MQAGQRSLFMHGGAVPAQCPQKCYCFMTRAGRGKGGRVHRAWRVDQVGDKPMRMKPGMFLPQPRLQHQLALFLGLGWASEP